MTSQGHSLLYPTGEGSHIGVDVGQSEVTSYKRVRRFHPTEADSLSVPLPSSIKANFSMITLQSGMKTYSRLDENKPPPAPSLDASLFRPSPEEREFLRSAVSTDDSELERRVLEVQKEYVCTRLLP